MNDFSGLTPALLAGLGIGDLPPVVQPELVRRLVEVMPKWRFRTQDLSLRQPQNAKTGARLQRLRGPYGADAISESPNLTA